MIFGTFRFECVGIASELFEDTGHPLCGSIRETSIDCLSLHTDLSDIPDREEGEEETATEGDRIDSAITENNPEQQGSSSRSSSSSSNHESSFSSSEGDCDLNFLFNHKEIAANPMRVAMLQRILSQYRNNPNDRHLQNLLSIFLNGSELVVPRRNRLRHFSTIQDAARLLR